MIVYMATNLINGKRYIGFTSQSFATRIRGHRNGAKCSPKSCRKFYNAIKKYGFDMFRWSVLGVFETKETGLEAEKRLISVLKPEYNISIGGSAPTLGLERSREWRDRLSAALKGKKKSPEEIARMSSFRHSDETKRLLAELGRRSKGRKRGPMPQEAREKISAAKKKFARDQPNFAKQIALKARYSTQRKVIWIETGAVFDGVRVAARETGISRGTIRLACQQYATRSNSNARKFRYLDEVAKAVGCGIW